MRLDDWVNRSCGISVGCMLTGLAASFRVFWKSAGDTLGFIVVFSVPKNDLRALSNGSSTAGFGCFISVLDRSVFSLLICLGILKNAKGNICSIWNSTSTGSPFGTFRLACAGTTYVKIRTLQKAKSAAPAGRDDKANSRSLVGHKAASLGMTA